MWFRMNVSHKSIDSYLLVDSIRICCLMEIDLIYANENSKISHVYEQFQQFFPVNDFMRM